MCPTPHPPPPLEEEEEEEEEEDHIDLTNQTPSGTVDMRRNTKPSVAVGRERYLRV